MLIYFGSSTKHKVATGAANITIACQKVGTQCLYTRFREVIHQVKKCQLVKVTENAIVMWSFCLIFYLLKTYSMCMIWK